MSLGIESQGCASVWGSSFSFHVAQHGEEWVESDLTSEQVTAMRFFKRHESLVSGLVREAIEGAFGPLDDGSPDRDAFESDAEGPWAIPDAEPQYRYSGIDGEIREEGGTYQIDRAIFHESGLVLLGGPASWDTEHGVGVLLSLDEVLEVGPYTDLC